MLKWNDLFKNRFNVIWLVVEKGFYKIWEYRFFEFMYYWL